VSADQRGGTSPPSTVTLEVTAAEHIAESQVEKGDRFAADAGAEAREA
jgi:hypothetical protein